MTHHWNPIKSERARVLVDDWLAANVHQSNSPAYLSHLLWCEARRNKAFMNALLRVACQRLATAAITNLKSLSKEA